MHKTKSKTDTHRITPIDNGEKWSLKRDGAQRSTKVFNTQREAIEEGRRISRNQQTELVIHGRNGRIREKDSHGNDPYPPKG